jgi:DNA-binding MarR family transcriptional regulator
MAITSKEVSLLRGLIFKITRISKKQSQEIPFSATEMNIIGHLDRNIKLLPSELAALEHVSAQAISQSLNNLANADFINRITDEQDKRKTLITLSDFGKTKLAEIKSTRDSWFKKAIEDKLDEQEIEQLKNAILLLTKITDDIKA